MKAKVVCPPYLDSVIVYKASLDDGDNSVETFLPDGFEVDVVKYDEGNFCRIRYSREDGTVHEGYIYSGRLNIIK